MRPGQDATLDDVGIHMYGSTDEGGSFYVKTNTANIDSDSIFHAGDLNWWHWLGDTPENNADAKRMAWREFKELEGLSVDVAMFPVDNRLEDAMEWGSIEFLRRVDVNKAFIPMHLMVHYGLRPCILRPSLEMCRFGRLKKMATNAHSKSTFTVCSL